MYFGIFLVYSDVFLVYFDVFRCLKIPKGNCKIFVDLAFCKFI